jgi:GNAT superfamily N-acetyltransferase
MRDAYLDGDVGAERRALWRARLTAPASNQHVVVAEVRDAVVGFACAFGAADPTWGTELDNLHVGRAAQNGGVGALLLRATARWTGGAHPDAGLFLWVVDGNTGARRFYERYGARDAGGNDWHAPDGSAISVRRYVWPPAARATLAVAGL